MDVDDHVKAICEDGRRSWLTINGVVLNYNTPRTSTGAPLPLCVNTATPMKRFVFQVDGFTQWDAEILPEGLRILYNRHRIQRQYLEDIAFRGDEFAPGNIVSWEQVRAAVRDFVRLSVKRILPDKEVVFD